MLTQNRPHLAFWGPLPPDRSGVADYNIGLLAELAKHYELEAFTSQSQAPQNSVYPVYPLERYTAQAIRHPFDLNLYQLSNSFQYGGPYYRQLLKRPGLSVFHDLSLFDMFYGLYMREGRQHQFWQEVTYTDGTEARASLETELMTYTDGSPPINRRRYPMLRRAIEHSIGAIVHSTWAGEQIRQYRPTIPVFKTELGSNHIPSDAGMRFRASRGWTADHLVIGALGRIEPTTRSLEVLKAFKYVHAQFPQTRLILAGYETSGSAYSRQVHRFVEEAGLDDALFFPQNVDEAAFQSYAEAVDVMVVLRWPNAGGSSAVMLRALGASKCIIASDAPQFQDYDPAFCWHTPTEAETEAAALIGYLTFAAEHLDEVRAAGQKAAEFVNRTATWSIVADKYREAIDQILTTQHYVQTTLPVLPDSVAPSNNELEPESVPGLHFIGDLASADGLSESRLSMLEVMLQHQIPVHLQTLTTASAARYPQADDRLSILRKRYPIQEVADYPIALLYANINELSQQNQHLWAQTREQYTIAVWFWELSQLDHHAYDYVGRVDEIWVPSRFVAEPFSKVTGVPIQVIPPAVTLTVSPQVTRAQFGLPADRYIFLFHFSAASGDARKNPWAVIEAFQKAFGKPVADGPFLVIKAHHLKAFPEMQTDLRAAVDQVGGVLIEDNYTRQQTNDLINCADAYVSLHRSEGFGLGLAEAMYLGKPVLGTDYSSSTDFLTAENGYPVRYVLRVIERDDHRYRPEATKLYMPGQMWAEADTDHAAEHMAMLYSSPEMGQAIGRVAAESIRRYCSPTVVGGLIRHRLIAINQQLVR